MERKKISQPGIGMLCGLGAAIIWGAWPVVTSIGVKESFSPFQMAFWYHPPSGLRLPATAGW